MNDLKIYETNLEFSLSSNITLQKWRGIKTFLDNKKWGTSPSADLPHKKNVLTVLKPKENKIDLKLETTYRKVDLKRRKKWRSHNSFLVLNSGYCLLKQ